MDYSKNGISKKKQNLRSSAPKAEKKVGFTIFRVFVICFILFAVIGISAAVGGVKGIIDSAPEINISDIAPKGFKSYIYDADGQLQHEIVGTGSNRIYVSIDEIGENVQNAFIALEDSRFRTHNGIDPKGIVRAFFVGLKNGGNFSEGASTITQQLLKLSVFSGGEEPSILLKFQRKFQEQYLALELEKQLSKDEILEAYLNTINLGQGCYGVEAASNYYFNKSADELTVSEAASLASIAQSPTNNNPEAKPENNNARRETTINYMYEQGLIDEETKKTALADTGIYERVQINAAAYTAEQEEVYTYYEEAAMKQVKEDLQTKLGYTEAEANDKLYSGAIKIYLAQDMEIQKVLQDFYDDDSNFPMTEYLLTYALSIYDDPDDDTTRDFNEYKLIEYEGREYPLYATEQEALDAIAAFKEHLGVTDDTKILESYTLSPQIQSSFVVIDQSTGYVSAIMAGRGEKTVNMGFNRATMATRQPGSVFKIVSTYAPALDYVGDTLATSKIDKNVETYNGHTIKNVDKYESNTNVTFREAILKSKNTVAVRTLQEDVHTDLALKYLTENFHFSTMDMQNDAVDALAIGGITNGVTNLELTAAFAALANSGTYTTPVFYTKVLDADDNVLLDNTNPPDRQSQSVKPTTAWLLTDAMIDVVTKSGGTAYGQVSVPNMTIAGKTGTTDDWKDTWFVGYSPYYTAGIWFGYDNNIKPSTRSGWKLYTHERLWGKIMTEIDNVKGLEKKDFTMPEGISKASLCSYSGKLAGTSCMKVTEYFDAANMPSEKCTECRYISVCDVCGGKAGPNSPSTHSLRYSDDDTSNIPPFYCTCQPETEPESESTGTTPGGETPGGTTPGTDPGTGGTPPNTPTEG